MSKNIANFHNTCQPDTIKKKIKKYVRFFDNNQELEKSRTIKKTLNSPNSSAIKSFNISSKIDGTFEIKDPSGLRSSIRETKEKKVSFGVHQETFSSYKCKDKNIIFDKRMSNQTPEKLINPFFQIKGYKLRLPANPIKVEKIEPKPVTEVKGQKNKPEVKEVEQVQQFYDVDEDQIQIITTTRNDTEDNNHQISDFDSSLIILQKNRIKTGSAMIKRAKRKETVIITENKKPKEVRVSAKNRYPVEIPTSAHLFQRDIEWKRKANPAVHQNEESLRKTDLVHLQKKRKAKQLQALKEFDYSSFM